MKSLLLLFFACMCASQTSAAERVIEPGLVQIPAGKIDTFACPGGAPVCGFRKHVDAVVSVATFEMGRTEVTFDEWDACVADGGCVVPAPAWESPRSVVAPCAAAAVCHYPDDETWGRGKRPVINVSWDDVQYYLKWLNAKTGKRYRLPTSVEWEYAAFAGARTVFPWGPKAGLNNANCDGCGEPWNGQQTAPVASFAPNRFGLYDMIGNVAEFVSTCYPERDDDTKCATYIFRGASWGYPAMDARYHADHSASIRRGNIGFRLAH